MKEDLYELNNVKNDEGTFAIYKKTGFFSRFLIFIEDKN